MTSSIHGSLDRDGCWLVDIFVLPKGWSGPADTLEPLEKLT